MEFTTVSPLARELGIAPKAISQLFYLRILDDTRCPIISGRRIIPHSYLPELKRVLRERGVLKSREPQPC